MTEHTRSRVDRTREYLLESELPEDTKDGLQSLLDAAAHAANGTEDRVGSMADAILALSLHEVRQAVRSPGIVRAAVAEHASLCAAMRKQATVALTGLPGIVSAWATALKPIAWPLALAISVALFSPHLPALLSAVRGAVQ